MTEADWISAVNLVAGRGARAGMTVQQRDAHTRLAAQLSWVRYGRPAPNARPAVMAARAVGGEARRVRQG
jgi:hypothetical protein